MSECSLCSTPTQDKLLPHTIKAHQRETSVRSQAPRFRTHWCWWHTAVSPAPGVGRQENEEFKVILGYTARQQVQGQSGLHETLSKQPIARLCVVLSGFINVTISGDKTLEREKWEDRGKKQTDDKESPRDCPKVSPPRH